MFSTPDLEAPRYRYKFKETLTLDFIKKFKTKYPQYAHYKDNVLINAIKAHNRALCKTVVTLRDGVELQASMGVIFIGTCHNTKKQPIAFKKSIELGIKVFHRNWETDNNIGKIFYSNYYSKMFENKHLWTFTAVRQFSREVAQEYPKKWKMFVSMDHFKNIWEVFAKMSFKRKAKINQDYNLQSYNEFNI